MEKDAKNLPRDERQAAKLRENLHRRKAQARSQQDAKGGEGNAALPKMPPKS